MVETIIGAAIGSALAQHNYTGDFREVNSKLDEIEQSVKNESSIIKSAIADASTTIMKKLSRLEIMQFLQLVKAPTIDGVITYTYPSGRKLAYEPYSQSILEYQEDGQLAFRDGVEQPIVTERFTENGVEFKAVILKGTEYFVSDDLDHHGTHCLSDRIQDIDCIKTRIDCIKYWDSYHRNLVKAIKAEYDRMNRMWFVRKWYNQARIEKLSQMMNVINADIEHCKKCLDLWNAHLNYVKEFAEKYPKAYAMLTERIVISTKENTKHLPICYKGYERSWVSAFYRDYVFVDGDNVVAWRFRSINPYFMVSYRYESWGCKSSVDRFVVSEWASTGEDVLTARYVFTDASADRDGYVRSIDTEPLHNDARKLYDLFLTHKVQGDGSFIVEVLRRASSYDGKPTRLFEFKIDPPVNTYTL